MVIPATACGGSAVMSFSNSATKIITVAENSTAIEVPPKPLGMKTIGVHSYLEALGLLAAYRAGISIEALHPKIQPLRRLL